jgi:hypothetical protein
MASGPIDDRIRPLAVFTLMILTAMIAVGVYGADALRSVRFASARLLVAVSLGIIALAVAIRCWAGMASGARPCSTRWWRLLPAGGQPRGGGRHLGTSAFRRRVLVLGAGRGRNACAFWPRADRPVLSLSAMSA